MTTQEPKDFNIIKKHNQDLELHRRFVKNLGTNIITFIQNPEMSEYVLKMGKPLIRKKSLKPFELMDLPHGYFIIFSDDKKDCKIKITLI
jgi:hypothetical protein